MTGILLLFVAAIWTVLVIWLSRKATSKLPTAPWRVPVAILIFAVLLPLPLIDEFVGGRQFEEFCKSNATIQVDRVKAIGKTVYLAQTPDVEIKGPWLRFVLKPWRFVDVTAGEPIVSYNTVMADGGRFIRWLDISEGGVPLTFKGRCEPGGVVDSLKLFKDLQITQVQRSELNLGEKK
jgi:hypothetical protein